MREQPDAAPQPLLQPPQTPVARWPWRQPISLNPQPVEQPAIIPVTSTNPVFNSQPAAAWFASQAATVQQVTLHCRETDSLLSRNACALETPCVFLFNRASASQNHRGRQPKGRRGQDHHRRQPCRLPRRRRPAGAALRPRPAGQRHQRAGPGKNRGRAAPTASCWAKAACSTKSNPRPSSGSKPCPARWICAPPIWNWRGWKTICCGFRNRSNPFWTATGLTWC